MAEFQKIMRIRERLCEGADEYCTNCPMDIFSDCKTPRSDELEEYEKVLTQWSEEHPEPVYPTWEEWQKQNFPDARFPLSLCHLKKGICPFSDDVGESVCIACRKQPIPAEIAEKLHIQPKGAKE